MGPHFRCCGQLVGREIQIGNANPVQPPCRREERRRRSDLVAEVRLVDGFELIILVTASVGLGDSDPGPVEERAGGYRRVQGRTKLREIPLELFFDLEVVLALEPLFDPGVDG